MKIAFASCSHPLKHPIQPGWLEIAAHEPDALLLIGDNTYFEDHWWQIWFQRPAKNLSNEEFAAHAHKRYRMQWEVSEFQTMLKRLHQRRVDVLGTLDDHDFLGNDLVVTNATQTKAKIARVLHRQFLSACRHPVPASYPDEPDWQTDPDSGFAQGLGVAMTKRYGSLLLTILDNRSYRQDPGVNNCALGGPQMRWLQTELAGDQTVSLIVSGSPLTRGTKLIAPGSPLSQYPAEYQRLRQLYKTHAGKNIVHIGGDLHYNEYKGRNEHVDLVEVCSSGMGTGFQPFSCGENGNYGLIEHAGHQLHIRTFGNDPSRNFDHTLPV